MSDNRPVTRPGKITKAAIETVVVGLFLPLNIWLFNYMARAMVDLGLLDLGWLAVAIGTCGGK